MNARSAETYLPCYRAGKPMDSRTLKAARYAEKHDTLRGKLCEQMDFDEQMVSAIHFIQPPTDLRQKLSALGAPAVSSRASLTSQLGHPAMLSAIAGGLLIIGFLVVQEIDRRQAFPGKESTQRMIATINDMSGVELEPAHAAAGDLGDAFYMRGYEGFALPPGLSKLPVVGMRVFKQNGRRIAQLAIDSHNALVFVFRATDFGVDPGTPGVWRTFTEGAWVAAIRADAGSCTMIAFRGEPADMRNYLATLQ